MPIYTFEIQFRAQIGGQFQFDTTVHSLKLQITRPFRSSDSRFNGSVHALGRRPALGRDVNSTIYAVGFDVTSHRFGANPVVYVLAHKAEVLRHVNSKVNLRVVVAVTEMRIRLAIIRAEKSWIQRADHHTIAELDYLNLDILCALAALDGTHLNLVAI